MPPALLAGETRPVILCEYCHSMGNSTGNIHKYWEAFESHPHLQVGCDVFCRVFPSAFELAAGGRGWLYWMPVCRTRACRCAWGNQVGMLCRSLAQLSLAVCHAACA